MPPPFFFMFNENSGYRQYSKRETSKEFSANVTGRIIFLNEFRFFCISILMIKKYHMIKFVWYSYQSQLQLKLTMLTSVSSQIKKNDSRTAQINLKCKGNENPKPTYTWFKEGSNNSILSSTSVYVIENVIRNNSGVYVWEVYNIIDDKFIESRIQWKSIQVIYY